MYAFFLNKNNINKKSTGYRVNGEFDFATNSKYKVDIIQQNQTKYLNL